jgi:hypothetical protein
VIAVNLEVLHETRLSDYLKRSDAGYTPDVDVGSFTYWCSDHRPYIQAAIFRDAYNYAQTLEYDKSQPSDDTEEDEDAQNAPEDTDPRCHSPRPLFNASAQPPFVRGFDSVQCRYSKGLADVAQLVEHFTRNEGVRGSNPRVGFPLRATQTHRDPLARASDCECGTVVGGYDIP